MNRFFFALWPDNTTREVILNVRSQLALSGRMTAKSNLHMTLLFLGKLDVNQQQNIIKRAAQIVCPEFEMHITHSGYFNNSKAAWLGVKPIPEVLLELHKYLLLAADKSHIPIKPQAYKPHVTLARKASSVSTLRVSPIIWPVTDFVLLESIDTAQGVLYQVVQHFTLQTDKKAGNWPP